MEYDPNEALKLKNQLCFPLYAAARKITGLYTPFLKPLGLTYTQYIVFMVLWERDGITMSELSETLFLDSGTLTPLVKKLEASGYLKRDRMSEDERRVLITLTEKGRALKEKAKGVPLGVGSCISLKPEEAAALYSVLYKILEIDKP